MTAIRFPAIFLAALLLTGCLTRPPFMRSAVSREWPAALAAARAASEEGQWAAADRHMADFIVRHPGSTEAHEAVYWRGVFRLAPGNDTTVQRLGLNSLQDYLARPGGEHRAEARVLLDLSLTRAALVQEAAQREREIAQIRTALGRAEERSAQPAARPADTSLAEEVTRLKAELAKANQELERIRKRLAGQRP